MYWRIFSGRVIFAHMRGIQYRNSAPWTRISSAELPKFPVFVAQEPLANVFLKGTFFSAGPCGSMILQESLSKERKQLSPSVHVLMRRDSIPEWDQKTKVILITLYTCKVLAPSWQMLGKVMLYTLLGFGNNYPYKKDERGWRGRARRGCSSAGALDRDRILIL